jgi:hypothetical protein
MRLDCLLPVKPIEFHRIELEVDCVWQTISIRWTRLNSLLAKNNNGLAARIGFYNAPAAVRSRIVPDRWEVRLRA